MTKNSKAAPRTRSTKEIKEATEFQRRRDHKYVTPRYMPGTRASTVILMHQWLGDIGSQTTFYTRGKETAVVYALPQVGDLSKL